MGSAEEFPVVLASGNTLKLVAQGGDILYFVGSEDPHFMSARAGECWFARVAERVKARLVRIDLLRRVEDARIEPPPPAVKRIGPLERRTTQFTPAHLAIALGALPDEFDVALEYLDDRGPFGIREGLVIRQRTGNEPHAAVLGGRYRMTPAVAGQAEILCSVVEVLAEPVRNSARATAAHEDMQQRFAIMFTKRDRRGPVGELGRSVVRPDRSWLRTNGVAIGRRYQVQVVRACSEQVLVLYVVESQT